MSTTDIKHKRSSVLGKVPTTGQLEFGEIAINTADGILFFKSQDSAGAPEVINQLSQQTSISDAIITLSAGSGLVTGGDFTTNQGSNETITFNLGTPGTLNDSTSNATTSTSHTHNIGSLNASIITSGVFDSARIPIPLITESRISDHGTVAVLKNVANQTISSTVTTLELEASSGQSRIWLTAANGEYAYIRLGDADNVSHWDIGARDTNSEQLEFRPNALGTNMIIFEYAGNIDVANGVLKTGGTERISNSGALSNVTANASIINAGIFDSARIPVLSASDITSGVFDSARIPPIASANDATITLVAGNGLITGGDFTTNQSGNETITFTMGTPGTLNSSSTNAVTSTSHTHVISSLATSQITSGVFDSARLPSLNVNGDTHGTFPYSRVSGTPTIYAEPGIFSGGGTPTLASGVTGAEIRSLIGAGTSSTTGTVTSVDITEGTLITKSGGPITSSGSITVNVDLSAATEAVITPSTDYMLFLDGGVTGTAAKESISDFITVIAGTGLENNGSGGLRVDNTVVVTSGTQAIGGLKSFSDSVVANNGISLGSAVAPGGATDLSRHLALWGTTYGFSITASTLNLVASGTNTLSSTNSLLTSKVNHQFNSGITLGGHTMNDIDITSEYSGADDHLMTSLAINNRILDFGYTTNTGTVTNVIAGNGMDFTSITGSGTVTMGTPGTLTGSTANGTTASSHTHAITTTGTGDIVAAVSPALTGTPTAPTAPADTNTTQIATTEYVQTELNDIGPGSFPLTVVTTNTSMVQDNHYHVADSDLIMTLPPADSGDRLELSVRDFKNTVIARNGNKIMGLDSDLTIDIEYSAVEFEFIDSAWGWYVTCAQGDVAVVTNNFYPSVADSSTIPSLHIDSDTHGELPFSRLKGDLDSAQVPPNLALNDLSNVNTDSATTGNLTVTGSITEGEYNLTGTVINPTNGTIQYKTLTANTTFTESFSNGQSITLMIDNGDSDYTVTWPTITWMGTDSAGVAPTLQNTGYTGIVLFQMQGVVYGSAMNGA